MLMGCTPVILLDEYKKEGLPGFPSSKGLPRQKGTRTSWDLGKTNPVGDPNRKITKGWWGEWASKRPEIEVYDKQGKHQGAYDPETGKFRKDSEEPTVNLPMIDLVLRSPMPEGL